MRVSLLKNSPLIELGETLVHVQVSEIDDPPKFIYSHSFSYKVPSGTDKKGKTYGEIIIYTNKVAASGGNSFSFDLEICHNKDCKNEDCSAAAHPNRLLVADVFHTNPKGNALRDFGTALFKALFSGNAGQLLQKTEPSHPNGRIYLQLNRHVDLDAIPWEYSNDRVTLLVHQRIFARVQAPLQKLRQNPIPKLLLRIVAVVPDPIILSNESGENLPDLHLSEQFQNFINGFTKNKKRVKLERVFPPTISQMGALLDTNAAMSTVLHFMGHCGQDVKDDSRALIFEHGETGKLEYINASRLVGVFKNLRLAFLSACNSRDIARVLVERGIWCTIGSNCSLPDNLARKFEFEFYKYLANGSTVEMAMYQARAFFQISDDIRQATYLPGAMVLYLSAASEADSPFKCEEGAPEVDLRMPPNNLMMSIAPAFRGRQKELSELYSHLRDMVLKGETSHIYTIKGIGGQEFVAEAMRMMSYLFPGGIFSWTFDNEKTAAIDYFRRLVETIFSKDVWTELTEQYGSDIQKLGSAIIQQFEKLAHATCLLILNHADILDLGEKQRNMHAMELGIWLRRVASGRVKILVTSNTSLDWCTGGMMDLKGSIVPGIYSGGHGPAFIHKYFAQVKEPIYFYDVPAENLAFVERSDILASMETALGACRILALGGLGGMGKTQLMLRYCYLHRASYDYVFWLEVDSWSTVVASFRKLAIKLGIDKESIEGEDSEKKIIEWIKAWFQGQKKWLLLLNNCDDDETINKLLHILPRIGGKIILTTRMHIPPRKATVIRVNKMQEQEAILLLYGVEPVHQKSTKFNYAQEIVTELDCMPLAINLARAYVERTRTTFQGYLSKFKEQKKRVKLLEYSDKNESDQYKFTVATVWQLSFNQIRALNPVAVRILEACAFLQPENIPVRLFKKQCAVLELISPFSPVPLDERDSEEFSDVIGEAITVLVEFSFVTQITREMKDSDDEDHASDLLTIHRLVQKVIYDAMDDEQRLRWAHNIATALNRNININFYYSTDFGTHAHGLMDTYLSHILHFAKLFVDLSQKPLVSKDLSELLNPAIRFRLFHETHFGIDDLVQFSIQISRSAYGEEHEQFVMSLSNCAEFYSRQNKYGEAERLFKRALEILEKVLGLKHLSVIALLSELAESCKSQGKYAEAEPLFKRALAIREEVLGPIHPETVNAASRLAHNFENQGKYDEAEPLFKRALAIHEEVMGPMHPKTAKSVSCLAHHFDSQGKYDEAEPLHKRALAIQEKVLGSEHSDTVVSLGKLGRNCAIRKDFAKAQEWFLKEASAIFNIVDKAADITLERFLNEVDSRNRQSSIQQLLNANEFEPSVVFVIGVFCELGLGISKNLPMAMELFAKAAKMNKLAATHRVNLLNELNKVEHDSTGQPCGHVYCKGEEYYVCYTCGNKNSCLCLRCFYSTNHDNHDVVMMFDSGSSSFCDCGDPDYWKIKLCCRYHSLPASENGDEAESPLEKKALASEHPDTTNSLNNLAVLHDNRGKYGEAEPPLVNKVLGSEHPDTATTRNNLEGREQKCCTIL